MEPENHPSGRYETDAYKTLRIRFPLPSDSGKYICVATNAGGVTEASAILQVLSEWTTCDFNSDLVQMKFLGVFD